MRYRGKAAAVLRSGVFTESSEAITIASVESRQGREIPNTSGRARRPAFKSQQPNKTELCATVSIISELSFLSIRYDVHLFGEILGLDPYRDFSVESSGIVLLKKMSNGEWRSYMYLPNNSNSEPYFIEGIVKKAKDILNKI